MLPTKKGSSTPWASGVNLSSMFASAQKEKNNAAELEEIERQLEELTVGPKKSMASPALAHMFAPESSTTTTSSAAAASSSSSSNNTTQNNANMKSIAKLHTKMLRNQKARYATMTWPGYMEEMYPEAQKLQLNRNKRNLARLAPYMNKNAQEEFKNNIQVAKNFVAAEEAALETAKKAQQTRSRYNPYGTVRYNGSVRYRKNRKTTTRKHRKTTTRKNRK